MFADEPTGNLDSRAGAALLGFLRDATGDLGQTIIMVTHDPVAAAYADRVVFLADGRIVDELADPSPESVARAHGPPRHPAAGRDRHVALTGPTLAHRPASP